MDTTDKLRGLLQCAGLTVSRVWVERPERRWTGPELLELTSCYWGDQPPARDLGSHATCRMPGAGWGCDRGAACRRASVSAGGAPGGCDPGIVRIAPALLLCSNR